MSESEYTDDHISSYIKSLHIPYPEKNNVSDDLKKINELLSKTKTFDAGIDRLKKYMDIDQDFNPAEYFNGLNYDQKFINMVMNALKSSTGTHVRHDSREDRSANRRELSSDGNIKDQIKKLRMKFDEMQVKQEDQVEQHEAPAQNNDEGCQERAEEIRRKIDEMKNRMTSNYRPK